MHLADACIRSGLHCTRGTVLEFMHSLGIDSMTGAPDSRNFKFQIQNCLIFFTLYYIGFLQAEVCINLVPSTKPQEDSSTGFWITAGNKLLILNTFQEYEHFNFEASIPPEVKSYT